MKILRLIIVAVLFFATGFLSAKFYGENTGTDFSASASDNDLTGDEANAPIISSANGFSLSPAKHDFGTMQEGEARDFTFELKREKNTPLELGRIYSPCPCVDVIAEKREFKKDEPVKLRVHIHSRTLHGDVTFPVFVQIDKPARQALQATVTATVTRVPADILLEPDGIHFGSVSKTKTVSIKICNLKKRPLLLGQLSCTIPGVSISLPNGKRIKSGEWSEIKLEIKTAQPGALSGYAIIETDNPLHKQIQIPVDGTVIK